MRKLHGTVNYRTQFGSFNAKHQSMVEWNPTERSLPLIFYNKSKYQNIQCTYLLTYICSRSHSIFRFSPFTLVIFFFFFFLLTTQQDYLSFKNILTALILVLPISFAILTYFGFNPSNNLLALYSLGICLCCNHIFYLALLNRMHFGIQPMECTTYPVHNDIFLYWIPIIQLGVILLLILDQVNCRVYVTCSALDQYLSCMCFLIC